MEISTFHSSVYVVWSVAFSSFLITENNRKFQFHTSQAGLSETQCLSITCQPGGLGNKVQSWKVPLEKKKKKRKHIGLKTNTLQTRISSSRKQRPRKDALYLGFILTCMKMHDWNMQSDLEGENVLWHFTKAVIKPNFQYLLCEFWRTEKSTNAVGKLILLYPATQRCLKNDCKDIPSSVKIKWLQKKI